jgi:hypothetical protein
MARCNRAECRAASVLVRAIPVVVVVGARVVAGKLVADAVG